ncbi:MAG: DUF1848 domain-containing protein [Roseburia sp.]|nr:DUF1848 domain-containing protein [Roseburia sp.]
MILSVSRRTDVPNYYSDWFYNRIKEGFVCVRNPMNAHQISRISLSPDVVDCIVFWTKNPADMLARLDELSAYQYYFQFTLTGYGRNVEPGLPDKRGGVIPTFRRLSERIGAKRVIWRYDPIFVNAQYTRAYHRKAFAEIAGSLEGYTRRVVISFVDLYAKTQRNMAGLQLQSLSDGEMLAFAGELVEIAQKHGMEVESCAESMDLESVGVRHGSCIDRSLTEEIIGCRLIADKDKNQRAECGCFESVEIGTYNTCGNGCKYCYANFSDERVREGRSAYDANSPLLCGTVGVEDKITERKVKSLKDMQRNLFEWKP